MRRAANFAVLACAAASLDCGSGASGVSRMRFRNQPPVTAVNDRMPAALPAKRDDFIALDTYDYAIHKTVVRATELPLKAYAQNVNAMDEVPDSTWFTNRIGVRELTPDEIRNGPLNGHRPAPPWKVLSVKNDGVLPGFAIVDGDGARYLLKLERDKFDWPYESTTDVIVNRLLWAAGYNVPEDEIVTFRPGDLTPAPNGVHESAWGKTSPIVQQDIDRVLARARMRADGTIRGMVSKFVPGRIVGGFSDTGVRKDDPNDVIPHEHRRELRGLHPLFAWLKNTDVKRSNTIDTWIENPSRPGTGHVVHYLIDFGNALGVMALTQHELSDGYATHVDFPNMAESLFSFGVWQQPWDRLGLSDVRGVGLYEVEGYEPGAFRGRLPWGPFEAMTDADGLWGAMLVARFTPEQLRAAIAAAQVGDRRLEDELFAVIRARQLATARYWFARVNPLSGFAAASDASGTQLCFDDLMLAHQFTRAATSYRATLFDYEGRRLGTIGTTPNAAGRACLSRMQPGASRGGYLIARIETVRPGSSYDPVLVHLARDPRTGVMRPIGVRR